jgi:hypothetical protein
MKTLLALFGPVPPVSKREMRRLLLLFAFFTSVAAAQETCALQTYASSWMQTGTPFSVQCPSGTYTGVLVTTSAKRFFRRGSLRLKFDQPVAVVNKSAEGVFKAGRGKQITSILLTGGSGIGAKDLLDGLSGAIFKSWWMIPITFGAIAPFEKGGDVNLKPGLKLQIVQTRAGS